MIKVGFDYDEPLFGWYAGAHAVCVRHLGLPEDFPSPDAWDPTPAYGITLQEWYDILGAEVMRDDTFYAGPLLDGVVDQVRRLYTVGHEVHILTARGQFGPNGERIKRLTLEQIIREGLPYDSLHFVEDKVTPALEIGLDYMVDDRDKYFLELNAVGVNCYLLDKPWNRDVETRFWDPVLGRTIDKRLYSTQEYVNMILNRHGAERPRLTEAQQLHVNSYR